MSGIKRLRLDALKINRSDLVMSGINGLGFDVSGINVLGLDVLVSYWLR